MRILKLSVFFALVLAGIHLSMVLSCLASEEPNARFNARTPKQSTISNHKPAPTAVGAMRPASRHLVKPRDYAVQKRFGQENITSLQRGAKTSRKAIDSYFEHFSKSSSTWVSPEVRDQALKRQSRVESATPQTSAVRPVTSTILALAVNFGGNDTFLGK
jgi:hypothetical protein